MSDERVVAWGAELRAVHRRLRAALDLARETVEDAASAAQPSRDLLLYCRGFCAALTGHHRGEDRSLFALVLDERPDLAPVVDRLKQDHSMIDHLVGALEHAVTSGAGRDTVLGHLDGIDAVMENHFRYEEKELVAVLDGVHRPELDRQELFGPLA
ncbi:hemerythrin domain-containing protein [Oerskovia flava]|uniref:hemerythrin domain-containing protein n=1 Tax=Oerskovia flava TaxID=2986422 RepID=UPI00223FF8BD|nr:hemerythrin domain-containing protein [Oerskovia sp. JB1-3-2]